MQVSVLRDLCCRATYPSTPLPLAPPLRCGLRGVPTTGAPPPYPPYPPTAATVGAGILLAPPLRPLGAAAMSGRHKKRPRQARMIL